MFLARAASCCAPKNTTTVTKQQTVIHGSFHMLRRTPTQKRVTDGEDKQIIRPTQELTQETS